MESIPNEFIFKILKNLDLKDLIKMTKLNIFFKHFIRNTKWTHHVINLR